MNPDITVTIGHTASPDHTVIWTVVITQLVAIAIFIAQAWFNRRSDRDKRVRDMKRDVLLEVAPAVQRLYSSLGELINPSVPIDAFAQRLRDTWGAIAKLQAVANDETLEAARRLVTALGTIVMHLMVKRVEVGTDLEAAKQLIELWHREVDVIPDLFADFSAKARSEIPLPIDKELLGDGIKESNRVMFAEMQNLLRALTEQQNGATRESQAGRANEQGEQVAGNVTVAPEQARDAAAELIALRQLATFWEYRYLNFFLVHRTQIVLDWLIERQTTGQATGIGYYDAELTARVVSPAERAAVLNALETHTLVVVNNGFLTVTDKGLDYARWRGPLQQLPTTRR